MHSGAGKRPRRTGRTPDASSGLRVCLLGGFSVSVEGRSVDEGGWRLRKAARLVKLLALAPGHRLHREHIGALLWPNLDEGAARNNLRHALHVARRTIEPDPALAGRYLGLEGEMLVLCPKASLWIDVEAYEEAAEAARRAGAPAAYRAAVELYTGDLLPGDLYEAWAQERREELRGTRLALLSELARLHEERGEYDPAVRAYGRVAAAEPTHEEAHAALMRLYAASGRRGEALGQYERLREVLSEELGAEPRGPVKRLYEQLVAGRSAQEMEPSPPPASPPRSGPSGVTRHNLPAVRTSFVGRECEVAEIKRLHLSATRLLTLTGAGGSGKTRLALEVARDLAGAYADGAWLVELAGLSEEGLVPQAVAEALSVREQPNRSLVDTLADSLRRKEVLLVLDNCEHLVEEVALLADTLLDGCPGLRVLATSREALDVAGETNFRVPSLSVPGLQHSPTGDDLEGYGSVRLFVERARRRDPAFVLTPENAPAVAEVCRRLDGVPLAIELAAARVGMAVEQVAARLDDSLGLLTTGGRTAAPRQRTLRGTLDWSYELLSEPERELFGRLSVFAGGWNLMAAEAVGAAPGEEPGTAMGAANGIERGDVLDLLLRLVDKSLVVAETAGGKDGVRYRMLEPIRQYAREKLEESDEAGLVLGRHAAFFLDLAEQATPQLRGPRQVRWLERLAGEHDDLRAAMRWLLQRGERETAVRYGWALWLFWLIRGHFTEGRRWMEQALANGGAMEKSDRAKALYVAGTMAAAQADYRTAEPLLEESTKAFEELGDERGLALALGSAGIAAVNQKRHEEGIALFEEAASLHRKLGYEWGTAAVMVLSAGAWLGLGDHGRAEQAAEKGLALARKVGDRLETSVALHALATVARASGDNERAKGVFEEGLALTAELGDKANVAYYLEGLAAIAASEDRPRRAAQLWGAAEALLEEIEATAYPHRSDRSLRQRQVAAARGRLDEALWTAAWTEGRAMPPERAVEYALSAEAPTTPGTSRKPRRTSANVPPAEDTLTRREEEVAALVGRGLTNRQIASELSISERTAANHVGKILKKLGLRSRSHLAARAMKRVPPSPNSR